MGWSAGAGLGCEIYSYVKKYTPKKDHKRIANFIYDQVCELDADDWDGDSELERDGNINQNVEDDE